MQFQAWSNGFAGRPNELHTLDRDVNMSAWAVRNGQVMHVPHDVA